MNGLWRGLSCPLAQRSVPAIVTCGLCGLLAQWRTIPEEPPEEVAATAGGVRISVSSTAAAGTYANFAWEGGGEGNAAPRRATAWTTPAPPGDLRISCSTPTREWPAQHVLVTDPHRYWRSTTMSDLGCPPGSSPGWAIPGPGRGATAKKAVTNLLASMTGTDWSRAAATQAPVGYVEAPNQTWIVSLSNRPKISVVVTTVGAMFEALPDTICRA